MHMEAAIISFHNYAHARTLIIICYIIISNSKVIITCLSTVYNVTIGIKQQCLFSLFMYFNNFETIIILEHLYSNIIIVQLIK